MENMKIANDNKETQKKKKRKVIAAIITLLILWIVSITANLAMGYGISFLTVIAPFQFVSGMIFVLSWGLGVPTILSAIIVLGIIVFVVWALYRLIRRIV